MLYLRLNEIKVFKEARFPRFRKLFFHQATEVIRATAEVDYLKPTRMLYLIIYLIAEVLVKELAHLPYRHFEHTSGASLLSASLISSKSVFS